MGQTQSFLSQSFNIPPPTFTEKDLPDQSGKVHIVTGGYTGCGLELVRFLYEKNATVYVAGRTAEKAEKAIKLLEEEFPSSTGRLDFLQVDLSDLRTIKPAVTQFLTKETRLDVLTNNAGISLPPSGSKTPQGHELTIGTNCLGPFLFTTLLLPIIQQTSTTAPPNTVRVTWAASLVASFSPKDGVQFDGEGSSKVHNAQQDNYAQSKAANIFLASELARRHSTPTTPFISLSWNPGNLKTELIRTLADWQKTLVSPILYPAKMGGYTELYAGWSPEVTREHNGAYVAPWGRIWTESVRGDVVEGRENGVAERFWEWCERETAAYK
ncbi:hypothetical protein HDV00_010851 [Rhizophlyctis rosea]|nr:hypothetical protein HDV00_010851 [Rhizophlyctis rosea]